MFPRYQNIVGRWCPSAGATGFTLADRSPRRNHASLTSFSATNWVTSRKLCAYFTSGGNMRAPRNGNLVAGNFAISLWINPQTLPGAFTPIFQCNNGASRELAIYYRSNGAISYTAIGSTIDFADRALGLTTGSWQHFACTRFGSLVSFYRNGIFTSSVTLAGTTGVSGATINIGDNSSAGDSNSNAYYDDIIVYNSGLAPAEVYDIYRRDRGDGLFEERRRPVRSAAGFKAYWARNRSSIIGAGNVSS